MARLTSDRKKEIEEIVESIKLKTGLTYPENGLIDMAKAMGIQVFEANFQDSSKINGAIQYEENNPKIYINKEYSPERKTFTFAHELGHYFLHKGKTKLRVDKYNYHKTSQESLEETEANYFASLILVSEDKLKKLLKLTRGENLDLIAKYFGVSKAVIENRLKWMRGSNGTTN